MNSSILIPRENTYIIDRKIINIHSEDRDVTKYPESNHFEITLPENLEYVRALRLVNCTLPKNDYVFSERNQNTKFYISIATEDLSAADVSNTRTEVTIHEGSYTQLELAEEIDLQLQISSNSALHDIRAYYDDRNNKIVFYSSKEIALDFTQSHTYNTSCKDKMTSASAFEQNLFWGLGYYLGYEKKMYVSQGVVFKNLISEVQHYPGMYEDADISGSNQVHIIRPLTPLIVQKDTQVYLELEHYNNMEELVPYQTGAKAHGNIKSAFASIPLVKGENYEYNIGDKNTNLHAISSFNEPIRNLSKLKLKFRYHDGRMVHFGNAPFSLTFEITRLGDKILKDQVIFQPYNSVV